MDDLRLAILEFGMMSMINNTCQPLIFTEYSLHRLYICFILVTQAYDACLVHPGGHHHSGKAKRSRDVAQRGSPDELPAHGHRCIRAPSLRYSMRMC